MEINSTLFNIIKTKTTKEFKNHTFLNKITDLLASVRLILVYLACKSDFSISMRETPVFGL